MKTLGLLAGTLLLALVLLFLVGGDERGPRGGRATPGTGPAAARTEEPTRPAPADATPSLSPAADDAPAADTARGRAAFEREEPHASTRPERVQTRTLFGTVVADEGPVRGAQVLLFAEGEPITEADADQLGRFELSFPLPQSDAVLRVTQRGFALFERALGEQRLAGQQHLGNLFLKRGTVLAGTVVDRSGRPLQGARVRLSTLRGRPVEDQLGETARTGADGRFQFFAAPQGPVVLTASAEGFGTRTIDHRHVAGQEARIVLGEGHDLAVRVVDDRGNALAGVTVTIRSTQPGSAPRELDTDGEGRVVFENLSEPEWTLRTIEPGYKPSGASGVRAGAGETLVRLVAWPCATGKVVTPSGDAPPVGTLVHALPGGARGDLLAYLPGGSPVEADGSFRVCDLRPGEYRLHVVAPGHAATQSSVFRVADVGEVSLGRIVLQRGGRLELELALDGEPVRGVTAELLQSAPVPSQLWAPPRFGDQALPTTDGEGRLALENLAPGFVWVILRGQETVPVVAGPFSVSNGDATRAATVRLTHGGRVRGVVRTASGVVARRARVQLRGPIEGVPFLSTDENGRFETPPLPEGLYTVEATSVLTGTLLEAGPTDARVEAGEATEVVMVVEER